jgi:hypothetical protein
VMITCERHVCRLSSRRCGSVGILIRMAADSRLCHNSSSCDPHTALALVYTPSAKGGTMETTQAAWFVSVSQTAWSEVVGSKSGR